MMVVFYEDQVGEIVSKQARDFEAPWLLHFDVGFREYSSDYEIFSIDQKVKADKDYLNTQNPLALQIFEGGFIRQGASEFELEDFARGASTAAVLFGDKNSGYVMDLMHQQLEAMYQRVYDSYSPFPPLDKELASLYSACVTLILLGEEMSVWHSMLTYVFGALWMIGLAKDVEKARKSMQDILLYYSRLGSYNGA